MSLQNSIKKTLQQISSAKTIWIAYSGGMDSHVLLHAASRLNLNFCAIHIHHGLLVDADQWIEHCEKICRDSNIDFQIVRVDVPKETGQSLEAAARLARYEAFARLLKKDDVLLTAHHQNDQAETCLLQFLRGSGVSGLAAMPAIASFAKGFLARPFLSVSRDEILVYARKHQLDFIEDPSNQNTQFTRNFLRHGLLPVLKTRWPNISETISRVADHAAEAKKLLMELAQEDLRSIQNNKTLSIQKLKQLSHARQKNALRTWIDQQGFTLPSTIKLQHIISDVIYAKEDAMPCVHWEKVEIRRYRDDLMVMHALPKHDPTLVLTWQGESELKLPANIGILKFKKTKHQGLRLPQKSLQIKFKQKGEVCRLKNRGTRALKKLFQEWDIPPWQRDRMPLIYIDNQLAAIPGRIVCEGFEAKDGALGIICTQGCPKKQQALRRACCFNLPVI